MSLTIGERYAGHFDIRCVLGSGGMGEVYRGHDVRLNRDVALKVLPDVVADDPDRLAQLQREAEVLASLNHPNIAQIYGIEEGDGNPALVLELVDGPTLEERIGEGRLPVDEALAIATQVADGLEAAHAAGVIHRDLKPANVKVRYDGTVKVLDFGLARASRSADAREDLHDAPTMESAVTRAGQIAGTPAYMSPEQIRGNPIDRRTDVWAFGAVLFEMLAGGKAFDENGAAGTLDAVLESEPDWESVSAAVAPTVLGVLRRCLAKDPRDRLRDIGDVRLGLSGAFDDRDTANAVGAPTGLPTRWTRRAVELASVAAVASLAATAGEWTDRPLETILPEPVQFAIQAAPRMGPFLDLSPDGRYLAYVAVDELGQGRLWLHSFASDEARPVPGVGGVTRPIFWSPDARFLAFANSGVLQRVGIAGGVVDMVSDATDFNGGSWNGDDMIVFGTHGGIVFG